MRILPRCIVRKADPGREGRCPVDESVTPGEAILTPIYYQDRGADPEFAVSCAIDRSVLSPLPEKLDRLDVGFPVDAGEPEARLHCLGLALAGWGRGRLCPPPPSPTNYPT